MFLISMGFFSMVHLNINTFPYVDDINVGNIGSINHLKINGFLLGGDINVGSKTTPTD